MDSVTDHHQAGTSNVGSAAAHTIVGSIAPNFSARSTCGDVSLSDYESRWVLLFFHPADFTPVCTSEFVGLAQRRAEFDAMNVQLLGISIDSVFSHLAWVEWIKNHYDVAVNFPILEDISMNIARAYGMMPEHMQGTELTRACCFISPEQRVEALIHYPMQVGRSIDEILRVFSALQEVRSSGASCPADWRAGDTTFHYPELGVGRDGSWLGSALKLGEK